VQNTKFMRDSKRPLNRLLLSSRVPMSTLIQVLAVAEHLNFHRAADALGASQPNISTRIKLLEQNLGVLLFERLPRGVRLTEAGSRFVTEVTTGIEFIEHALQTAGAFADGSEGHLAIGLQGSISSEFLVNLRTKFRTAYPKVIQSVKEDRSTVTISLVREGKLDITFVAGSFDAPDCQSLELWHEPFAIVLPIGHALAEKRMISWSDLASEVFLVRTSGFGPQLSEHIVRRVGENGRSPHIFRCDVGQDTLVHMVAGGEGIALTIDSENNAPFSNVVVRSISDEGETAHFTAVWSQKNHNPALENLLSMSREMKSSTISSPD